MGQLHTDSHSRPAIVALRDSNGFLDALLGLPVDQIMARRPAISPRPLQVGVHDPQSDAARSRADLR